LIGCPIKKTYILVVRGSSGGCLIASIQKLNKELTLQLVNIICCLADGIACLLVDVTAVNIAKETKNRHCKYHEKSRYEYSERIVWLILLEIFVGGEI